MFVNSKLFVIYLHIGAVKKKKKKKKKKVFQIQTVHQLGMGLNDNTKLEPFQAIKPTKTVESINSPPFVLARLNSVPNLE